MSRRYRIEKAKWITPFPDKAQRVRACRISGLETVSWYGDGDKQGRPWIDASIAGLIVSLNRAGFPTIFCCSGLPEDHDHAGCPPYIMFQCESDYLLQHFVDRFPTLPEAFKWDGDLAIRAKAGTSVETLRVAWVDLELAVNRYLARPVEILLDSSPQSATLPSS